MSVPILGIYRPANKDYFIEVAEATPANGQIHGGYGARFAPEGGMKSGLIGFYAWVNSAGNNSAPFVISFRGFSRPAGHVVLDQWNGFYRKDDTMLLTGTRAYVNEDGTSESICLGTMLFALIQ